VTYQQPTTDANCEEVEEHGKERRNDVLTVVLASDNIDMSLLVFY
jgi:hypothetical protein